MKNTSASKSIRQFLDTLEVKPKTDVRRFCATKSNSQRNKIWQYVVVQYTKETEIFKIQSTGQKSLYNWTLTQPQFAVSPIENYCLKLSINSQSEPQLVPKLILRVSVRELHNSMVNPRE